MLSARQFLHGMIDYAGLFPPASLGMDQAVEAYTEYSSGPDRDLLGRFIVPANRLDELARSLNTIGRDGAKWHISVIAGTDFLAARDASFSFNASMASRDGQEGPTCDAIEVLAPDAAAATAIVEGDRDPFDVFVEIPLSDNPSSIIAGLSGSGVAAKIRTGGITAAAFPSAVQVLGFMTACLAHGVPFKATAGLHHLVRAEYPLTYEREAPLGEMFGYLNIFLAAAALYAGWEHDEVAGILEETDVSRFNFSPEGATVNGQPLSVEELSVARRRFALSFGSCSFTEPVSEARASGLV